MSIQIESSVKIPNITIQKDVTSSTTEQSQSVVVETKEIIHYVKPNYNINIIDSFGGFFILLAAILLVIKLAGGNDFFGSLIRGVATVVGGAVLFVYCFGMAVL